MGYQGSGQPLLVTKGHNGADSHAYVYLKDLTTGEVLVNNVIGDITDLPLVYDHTYEICVWVDGNKEWTSYQCYTIYSGSLEFSEGTAVTTYADEPPTDVATIDGKVLLNYGTAEVANSKKSPRYFRVVEGEEKAPTLTNLTNTTWYVPSGWSPPSSALTVYINGNVNGDDTLYFEKIILSALGKIIFYDSVGEEVCRFTTDEEFSVRFVSGDVRNADLIKWLETYGIQLKVTDLTNTTWTVKAGWEAKAGYGHFHSYCTINDIFYSFFRIGYNGVAETMNIPSGTVPDGISLSPVANSICCDDNYAYAHNRTTDEGFTVTFTDVDVTNPKLIAWLSKWGELQVEEEEPDAPEETPTEYGEIVYDGKVIATLTEGQSVVLKCKGFKGKTDIVIKNVGEVEEEKTEATVTITNTSATYTADVSIGQTGLITGIGLVSPNETKTFTVTIGETLWIFSSTGVMPAWETSSITGDIEATITTAPNKAFLVNGDGAITGYACDWD